MFVWSGLRHGRRRRASLYCAWHRRQLPGAAGLIQSQDVVAIACVHLPPSLGGAVPPVSDAANIYAPRSEPNGHWIERSSIRLCTLDTDHAAMHRSVRRFVGAGRNDCFKCVCLPAPQPWKVICIDECMRTCSSSVPRCCLRGPNRAMLKATQQLLAVQRSSR
jgi:hypothetical protein